MPGLRRLRDPERHPGLHARARPHARADRVRLRDRLRRALPVLHADLRDALDPRPRARDRDGARGLPAGPVRLGRDRGRRRALDRRQPPHPRAPPEREPEDPPLQQPHLRPDEGPVLADLGARQGDEVDSDGLARLPVQPALDRDRRGGVVRRARDRHRQEGADRGARRGRPPPRLGVRRDPPELQHLQRRRVRLRPRREGQPHLPRERRAHPLRRGRREGRRAGRGRVRAGRGRGGRRRGLAPRARRRPARAEPRVRALADHVRDRRRRAVRRLPQRRAAGLRRPHERAARGGARASGRGRPRGAAPLRRHLDRRL